MLEQLPGIEAAFDAPLVVRDSPPLTPTDPLFNPAVPYKEPVSKDLMAPQLRDQWNVRLIKAPLAWGFTTGEGVTVGVVDSGVDPNHDDLEKLAPGSDNRVLQIPGKPHLADPHGTLVAGIIAAQSNERGMCGIAPDAQIFSCVYGGKTPLEAIPKNHNMQSLVAPEPADWIAGIVRAVDAGVKVINCSWHLEVPCCASARDRQAKDVLYEAILVAMRAGVTIVCSMGNRSHYNTPFPYESWPVVLNGTRYRGTELVVIGVGGVVDGSSPEKIVRHPGSNYGEKMTVMAPGHEVPSTDLSGTEGRNRGAQAGGVLDSFVDYAPLGGTSAAAAHVSGVVALMLSVNPNLTPKQVRGHLAATALKIGTLVTDSVNRSDEYGYGLVQATAAARVAGELALKRILAVLSELADEDRMMRMLLDGFMSHTEVGQVFAGRFWQVSEDLASLLARSSETAEDVREIVEELYPLIRATVAPPVLSRRLDRRRALQMIRLLAQEIRQEGPSPELEEALEDGLRVAHAILKSNTPLADELGADSWLRQRSRRFTP
jgi:subtilisin family serine protease